MLDAKKCFILGYTVPAIGIHFNAVDLLAQAKQGASPELEARVKRQVEVFGGRQKDVIEKVRTVMSLLHEAGFASLAAPPRVPGEYYEWEEKIKASFDSRIGANAPALATARTIGHLVGSALLSLNIGVLAEHLRAVAPTDPWLTAQTAALGGDQSKIGPILRRALDNPLLPAAARTPFTAIVDSFNAAPLVGHGSAAENAELLSAAMHAISTKLGDVEAAFADALPPN